MSNSLNSVKSILSTTPNLKEWLKDADKYLAHTSPGRISETLEEHVTLVDRYFGDIILAHGLDPVIDQFIHKLVEECSFQSGDHYEIATFIKNAFVKIIHFHDFGKVNEDFQASSSKMNNPLFKSVVNNPLESKHSALGAYLFIAKHLQESMSLPLNGKDMWKIHFVVILLSYPIFKHHAAYLSKPINGDIEFREEVNAMKGYLKLYHFEIHQSFQDKIYLQAKNAFFDRWETFSISFSLFTLIKLNFSLLTASDYLATHEYMSGERTSDFGVFNNRERIEQIISNLRTTHAHNRNTFSNIGDFEFQEASLREKSKTNLNKLRQEMAVELVQTVRKHTQHYLFYIEAPTGGGKTNLSMIALTELMAANPELNKVYYVFPFTTLITQTYKALKETLLLEDDELVELHSKAGFHSKDLKVEEKKDGEFGSDKKDFIDNLFALYPLTVLSHVRFFEVLKTNRKEANYLLHRLANSVVIIDELQTYNPKLWDKMLYFINEYARSFNIRFILMSATLPKISDLVIQGIVKPEFIELLPNARKYITNPNFAERVKFNFELFEQKELQLDELAKIVVVKSFQYVEINDAVHTIVEFIYKKTASEFKNIIDQSEHIFDEIFVLSGTVLEPQRRKIITFLKNEDNRRLNILLITTQVVEAGVDIDMDLGFKNISLIDSDEQLAGRVNRNASKEGCEVYLFRIDDPKLLYKNDDRFKVTSDKISRIEYENILNKKNFKHLYQLVFERRDKFNENLGWADNFQNSFLDPGIKKLNYEIVDKEFKIIDQQNESVFVPIELPVLLENGEFIFSRRDLEFLGNFEIYKEDDLVIDGKQIWELYQALIFQGSQNRKKKIGFDMERAVQFKTLQSIMSKFTFSLFSHSKTVEKIKSLGFGEEKYGFLNLNARDLDLNRIYTLEGGLSEVELNNDNENLFL
ncbi:CRISPR-associated helicase Cas3' [Dyadobacter sp. LHD-138]|uniref:CRISPR-associated helicase Cas3' n=1 Tax=Dyadobacter sp. LHD-138 TaxID=3071413 RepID=UPI0027DEC6B7|nr:CRISPR-associated helicase Cas3' [Dyadobacter sp. LHD-138]MDQ6477255.1 CRISPR-associated helicase Cas3' [Dyadobacter sp. LHD-138]